MGSENLHHKRKQQTRDALRRKISKREPYDIVLVVCEGKKTEPNYLQAFCDELKLSSANIKLVGLGASPLKIAEHALRKFNADKDYDRVYCIFDKDQHHCFHDALAKIKAHRERARNPVPIHAITSIPCFEYWLLLHFADSTRPYASAGGKSAGDQLLSEVKNHIKDYHKGDKTVFEKTKSNLETAIARAKKIHAQQAKNGTDNPSTNMFELIEYLSSIKIRNRLF